MSWPCGPRAPRSATAENLQPRGPPPSGKWVGVTSAKPRKGPRTFFFFSLLLEESLLNLVGYTTTTNLGLRFCDRGFHDTLERLLRRVWLRKTPPGPVSTNSLRRHHHHHHQLIHPARRTISTMTTGDDQSPPGNSSAKLHGRAFYESIGSPKYIVAPMVDQSEFVRILLSYHSFLVCCCHC